MDLQIVSVCMVCLFIRSVVGPAAVGSVVLGSETTGSAVGPAVVGPTGVGPVGAGAAVLGSVMSFTADRHISATAMDAQSGDVFIAAGTTIYHLQADANETWQYPIELPESEKVVPSGFREQLKLLQIGKRCKHSDCTEEITNEIVVLQPYIFNNMIHILACLNDKKSSCFQVNLSENKTVPVNFTNRASEAHLQKVIQHCVTSSVLLVSVGPDDTLYLNIALDVEHDSKVREFNRTVISMVKLSIDDSKLSLTFDKLSSKLRAESMYRVRIVKGFQYKHMTYYVMNNFWSHQKHEFRSSLVRLSNNSDLTETPLICGHYRNVSAADYFASADDSVLYLLYQGTGEKNTTVCQIYMSQIETYFQNVERDCYTKGIGSATRWVAPHMNTCGKQIGDTPRRVLSTSTLFARPVTTSFTTQARITSMVVARQSENMVAFLLDTQAVLTKMRLDASSQKISTFALSDRDPTRTAPSMWLYRNTLYVARGKTMQSFPIDSCGVHNDSKSCLRDVIHCVWCRHDLDHVSSGERCMEQSTCGTPGTVNWQPKTISMTPASGPRCGGSVVTIGGNDLDTVSNISVVIGQQECRIVSVTTSALNCLVPKLNEDITGKREVMMNIILDTWSRAQPFTYLPDPRVIYVEPNTTIVSGGLPLTFHGRNLDVLDRYVLQFVAGDMVVSSPGDVCRSSRDGTALFCDTGPVVDVNATQEVAMRFSPEAVSLFGAYLNLSTAGWGILDVLEDPRIYRLQHYNIHVPVVDRPSNLTLYGEGLTHVRKSDIRVQLLRDPCVIFYVNGTELRCTLKYPSGPTNPHGESRRIMVQIGSNLLFFPGVVVFKEITDEVKPRPPIIIRSTTVKDPVRTTLVTSKTSPTTNGTNRLGRTLPPVPRINTSTNTAPVAVPQHPEAGVSTGLIAVLSIIGAACVIFAVGVVCRKRSMKKVKDRSAIRQFSIVSYRSNGDVFIGGNSGISYHPTSDGSDLDGALLVADGTDETPHNLIARMKDEDLLIPKEILHVDKIIGQGNFGSVFKGYLLKDDTKQPVAVKTLHSCDNGGMDVCQFLEEAYVMKDFRHENVMRLVGVCLDQEDKPLVILPFMQHGDLLSYLREDDHILTVRDLVSFGLGIAKGMEYLASLKFVHRDLAARNCMLDLNFHVKVADFGLSRDIYETSYYSTKSKGTKLPVKWMAVESLSNGVFSEYTDVWSFGVTLWELNTRGVRPYAAVDSWDMEHYLMSGRRLPQPLYCPANLYKVMRKCWSLNPYDRPTFAALRAWISDMLNKVHHHLGDVAGAEEAEADRKADISTTYVNLANGSKYLYENVPRHF